MTIGERLKHLAFTKEMPIGAELNRQCEIAKLCAHTPVARF